MVQESLSRQASDSGAMPTATGSIEALVPIGVDDSQDKKTYFVGWENELRGAWRLAEGCLPCEKEYTKQLAEPSDATDEKPVIATWHDGFSHPIAAVTVAKLRSMLGADKQNQKRKAHWSWTGDDGRLLEVRTKADRNPLVYLNEKVTDSHQVCQARVDIFASEQDAIDLMVAIAKAYSSGAVRKDDLYPLRDNS